MFSSLITMMEITTRVNDWLDKLNYFELEKNLSMQKSFHLLGFDGKIKITSYFSHAKIKQNIFLNTNIGFWKKGIFVKFSP